jgi:hypothetical protein
MASQMPSQQLEGCEPITAPPRNSAKSLLSTFNRLSTYALSKASLDNFESRLFCCFLCGVQAVDIVFHSVAGAAHPESKQTLPNRSWPPSDYRDAHQYADDEY